ncbi:NADPH-dependent FMN reductase [Lentzea xinjiangensis]|uniref:NADPH-dependent FMN reductase n=1 Tax=Lentzea xinjiangensis TaxID=402600 RepID=A0A1H9QJK0_9PSEU|nr:NAD(P)H-dependent oxidoreductase [Lentzea xinjiangensis]SER60587.1 NADPH-dependent FMN reductase [Lentzea xinjiangensis]
MTRIAIVLGSTRPGRDGEAVAKWVHGIARDRDDAEYELVDTADFRLPHLDEVIPPALGSTPGPTPGRGRTRSPRSRGTCS